MGRQTATAVRLKPEDYRLLAEFRRLLRQFLVFSEQQALGVGLAPQQHQALLAIKGSPDGPPTVGDLAERLAIRHSSAVGLINRLVSAGPRRGATIRATSGAQASL
jgi:DNA-binding MarR family transcriptional regulator